ncbi:NAD-dependent epimerase/dehydratase family protein [Aspergillus saccharolyticus JOP 1030-1]|uniref:NAD(P)-binding protein n=1 Tax=Aspergillus saccharolyticus JOP 1030-1 TaxID=1450539 RepID=A0A318ZRQ4_9EURO|nr:NAD(P)-binding protein [Aspergillus saccharolyticus JOP 1030-1]PYH47043.1 NAD(P)-binding protein [Aspergillus saccharolyticus JOP 1030-1]
MSKRIIVTGGSGKAGQFIIAHLLHQNYSILNLDLHPLPAPLAARVHTLRVDLTDTGQVHSAMHSHFALTEPFRDPLHQVPTAVIHLAGYARNMIVPDNETYRGNVLAFYNVLEAACQMGIRKILLASSICVYGVAFAEGDVDYPAFPVDESVPAQPMDVYAISKVCGEQTAAGFAKRYPETDVYVYRFGAMVSPEEFQERFTGYVERPGEWKVHGWAYTDARDLGLMVERGLMVDGLGFQVFNAVNDEMTNFESSTEAFLARVCPGVPVTRELIGREAPVSNRKLREVLGFVQRVRWQDEYLN